MSGSKHESNMILLIDGLGTSGKAVLRGLLEGHPNFFVTPNHDMIVDCLCSFESDDWLKYKDILELRSMLSNTYYYQLEWFTYRKYLDYDMSVKDRCEFAFDLDFYNFDRMWMECLNKENEWTPQIVATHILKSMLESWSGYPYEKENIKYYTSMGFDRPNTANSFVKYYPNGKMIYLIRSINAIIATRSNRRPVADDMRSMCLLETTPEKLVKSNHVRKLINKQKEVEEAAKLYPDKIMIVDFDEMIINTESTMKNISTFLGVDFHESMLTCKVMGKEMVTKSGDKYVGKVLDDPNKLLNDFQKAIIDMDISLKNCRKYTNNFFAIFFIIFLRIKRVWLKLRVNLAKMIAPEIKESLNNKWKRDGFFD